jgi:hypothetical protein
VTVDVGWLCCRGLRDDQGRAARRHVMSLVLLLVVEMVMVVPEGK